MKGQILSPFAAINCTMKDGNIEGEAKIAFKNGDSYNGEMHENQMTGYGEYKFEDQTTILGYFENSACEKHAKIIFKDGRTYVGEI